jgi:hypothetical protein
MDELVETPKSLTPECVREVATLLYEQHRRRPTQAEIRQALGRGSMSTINAAMKAWSASSSFDLRPLPATVVSVLDGAANALWRAALKETGNAIEAEKIAADARLESAGRDIEDLSEQVDDLQDKLIKCDAQRTRLAEELQAQSEFSRSLEVEMTGLRSSKADLALKLKDAHARIQEYRRRATQDRERYDQLFSQLALLMPREPGTS